MSKKSQTPRLLFSSPISTYSKSSSTQDVESHQGDRDSQPASCRAEHARDLASYGEYSLDMDDVARKFWPMSSLEKRFVAFRGIFADVVRELPVFLGHENGLFSSTGGVQLTFSKVQLSMCFERIWASMKRAAVTKIPRLSSSKLLPELVYYPESSSPGVCLDSSMMFCNRASCKCDYSSALLLVEFDLGTSWAPVSDRILRRVGERVLQVWHQQPTRQFVPVLLFGVMHLRLLLFTRGKWYCIELGGAVFDTLEPGHDGFCDAEVTLQWLWFLASSPPSEIGHICDIPRDASKLIFAKASDVYQMSATQIATPDTFISEGTVQCTGGLCGTLCHVIHGAYGGKAAIMKIMWTAVGFFPEGAAYDILQHRNVNSIPKAYRGGVLVKDLCGYRMDFLIVEHCGWSLYDYIRILSMFSKQSKMFAMASMVRQVSSCLARAHCAGVLHRDISKGNITIKRGRAYIIDWGCSRPLINAVNQDVLKDVCWQWSFHANGVSRMEKDYDPFTGTRRFMSISVLSHNKQRGLHDDIESLFYVVLDLLLELQNGRPDDEPALDLLLDQNSREMALTRAEALENKSEYLERFGIYGCPRYLSQMLDAMYDYLFVVDGGNIIMRLLDDGYFRKNHDYVAAAKFMDSYAIGDLKRARTPRLNSAAMLAAPPAVEGNCSDIADPTTTIPWHDEDRLPQGS